LEKGEYNNALGAMKLITRLGGLESKWAANTLSRVAKL